MFLWSLLRTPTHARLLVSHTLVHTHTCRACTLSGQTNSSIWTLPQPERNPYLHNITRLHCPAVCAVSTAAQTPVVSVCVCVCCCVRCKYSVVAAVSHIVTKSLRGLTPHLFTKLIDFCSALWESNPHPMHTHTLLHSTWSRCYTLEWENSSKTAQASSLDHVSLGGQWQLALNMIPLSLKGIQRCVLGLRVSACKQRADRNEGNTS